MTAGAYGAVMSSTYNTRLLVPEVLVKGDDYAVVRPRPSYDELIGLDRLPDWLALATDTRRRTDPGQTILLTQIPTVRRASASRSPGQVRGRRGCFATRAGAQGNRAPQRRSLSHPSCPRQAAPNPPRPA